MKHTEKFIVDAHHCDAYGELKVSALLKFMNECATKQLIGKKMSEKYLLANGKTYVLCRLNMSIYKSARFYDEIEVSTWACESRGAALTRCFSAKLNGVIIAEAVTVWGIIDIQNRRLCRLNNEDMDIETDEPLELDTPARIQFPEDLTLGMIGDKTVSYADVDYNGHMNNTNYPDMYCDVIPKMNNRRIITIQINYLREAPLGECLKIYKGESDGLFYFKTVRLDGQTNTEAVIMTEDRELDLDLYKDLLNHMRENS